MSGEEIRTLAHNELELFVRNFAKKYRTLFVNRAFIYKIHPSTIPEIDFPYEVNLEIRIKEVRKMT